MLNKYLWKIEKVLGDTAFCNIAESVNVHQLLFLIFLYNCYLVCAWPITIRRIV